MASEQRARISWGLVLTAVFLLAIVAVWVDYEIQDVPVPKEKLSSFSGTVQFEMRAGGPRVGRYWQIYLANPAQRMGFSCRFLSGDVVCVGAEGKKRFEGRPAEVLWAPKRVLFRRIHDLYELKVDGVTVIPYERSASSTEPSMIYVRITSVVVLIFLTHRLYRLAKTNAS
jgi:hypothetical protein